MKKIRIGDTVIITTGKDKGKTGEVLKLVKSKGTLSTADRVIVRGMGMVSKHIKPDPQSGVTGGIERQERSIHLSNISILNPTTNKADRIGFSTNESGMKYRMYKSDKAAIDTQADIERSQKFRTQAVASKS